MSVAAILFTLVMIAAFVLLFSLFKFATIKLFAGDILQIDTSDIPGDQVDVLIEVELFLNKQGFVYRAHVTRGPVMQGQPWGLYGALYVHETTNTWALAYVEPLRHPVFTWRLQLITPTEAAGYLATLSGVEFGGNTSPPDFHVHDAQVYSPQEQWLLHQDFLAASSNHGAPADTAISDILYANEMLFFQGLVETATVVPWGEGYRLPIKQCFQVFTNLFFIQRKLLAQKAETDKSRTDVEAGNTLKAGDSAESQLAAYESFKQVQESNKAKWLSKAAILLISVLAFSASFGLMFSLDTLLMLIVVLFIHEAGHLLGMWIFGYRDLRMMFIPFMGALASGKKEQVKTWQEAIILLLGPMPGYVMGSYILLSGSDDIPPWLVDYALMSFILNALNLLPFMPLDGGRVVNLALFNRLPVFQLILTLLSIVALGYAGLVWGEPAGLIIGVVLIISLPHLWKEVQLLKYLLAEKVHDGYTGVKQLIEVMNHHPVWAKQLPQNRWSLLDSLSYRVQHASAGLLASTLTLTLWIATIVLPVYTAMSAEAVQNVKVALGIVTPTEQFQAMIEVKIDDFETLDSSADKAQAAMELSHWLANDRPDEGLYYWRQLKVLVASKELSVVARGDYYSQMSNRCESYESDCEVSYLKQATAIFGQTTEHSPQAVSAFYQLALIESEGTDERLTYVNSAEQKAKDTDSFQQWAPALESVRGSLFEEKGELDVAELHLLNAVNASISSGDYSAAQYQRALINFYARHDKVDASIQALNGWITSGAFISDEWTLLQDNPHYALVWLLYDSDPHQASFHFKALKSNHKVEGIELALANILISEQSGLDIADHEHRAIAGLVSSIENIDNWGMISSLLIESDTSVSDGEYFDQQYYAASADWYEKMRALILRPEYASVAGALKKYRDEFDY